MLFLPYSNGRKKLLPIKEIPKPILRNLSPTTLIYYSDMMRITLLILGKIDTICLACTMAKNATQYLPMHCYFPLLWWCSLKKEFPQAFDHLKLSFGKSWHFRLKKMTRIFYWLLESKKWKKHYSQITIHNHCSWYCSLRNFVYLKGVCPLSLGHNSFSITSFF